MVSEEVTLNIDSTVCFWAENSGSSGVLHVGGRDGKGVENLRSLKSKLDMIKGFSLGMENVVEKGC